MVRRTARPQVGLDMLHAWNRVSELVGLDPLAMVWVMMPSVVRTAIEAHGVPSDWRTEAAVDLGDCEASRSSSAVKKDEEEDIFADQSQVM